MDVFFDLFISSASSDVSIYRRVQKLSKAQNRKELRISPGSPESDNETSDSETVKLTVRTQCSELTLRFSEYCSLTLRFSEYYSLTLRFSEYCFFYIHTLLCVTSVSFESCDDVFN